jgi:hypothetical protein
MLRITLTFALVTTGAVLGNPPVNGGEHAATTVVAQAQPQGRREGGAGEGMRGGGPSDGAMRQQRRMLQMMDQDGDGMLSHEEFVETPRPGAGADSEMARRNRAARFDQLDTDGDGQLDAGELANLRDMPAQ